MDDEYVEAIPVPSFPDFCLNTPLYASFAMDSASLANIREVELYHAHLDSYCLECKQQSVFTTEREHVSNQSLERYSAMENTIMEKHFVCSRDSSHQLNFYFRFHDGNVTKLGQYPSLADLATYDIRKYEVVLGKDRYSEFARAVGLISHGVGIGSFVYLRRIIEQLVEEAHEIEKTSSGWNEDQYVQSRMDEKIRMLKNSLPEFLLNNRQLYSILSKGVHELEEQECLNSFSIVKVGIELILDEKLEKLQRQKKIDQAQASIEQLNRNMKKRI